jgi:hypothetical protein
MPTASTDGVAGHRSKYEIPAASLPPEEVGISLSEAPILTGYSQLELIRSFVDLPGASVVDIGCGIGCLTRHMIDEKIEDYLRALRQSCWMSPRPHRPTAWASLSAR